MHPVEQKRADTPMALGQRALAQDKAGRVFWNLRQRSAEVTGRNGCGVKLSTRSLTHHLKRLGRPRSRFIPR